MGPGARRACDFPHFDSPRQQRVRDQGAMTAPGNGFSAHDGDPLWPRKFYQLVQIVLRACRERVVVAVEHLFEQRVIVEYVAGLGYLRSLA